jgi:DNA-binding SARP family transcriptional activator
MWVGLLGPLVVRGDGGEPLAVGAAKQRIVLAALALRAGRVVPFGELADVVWDESPPAGARVTLRNYVWRLRLLLGPAGSRIVTRDGGYLLEAARDQVDVLEFSALCREGGAATRSGAWQQAGEVLGQALELWRGPPLADVPSRVLAGQWVRSLERERSLAVEWRIEAQLQQGMHAEVLGELDQLSAGQPYNEHLYVLRMLALYRSGRAGDALAVFERAGRVLADELGVGPGDQLRRLRHQVLARDAALEVPGAAGEPAAPPGGPVVVPRQLPATVAHFAGRSAELRLLAGLAGAAGDGAAGGTVAISAVGGTAGVGKTALAVQFGHLVADRFPDGQLYADLRGFGPGGEPVSPGRVMRWFLAALGVAPPAIPPDAEAQAGLYRSLLAGKRVLVVLDNARDVAQVRPLLPGSMGCLVVVTSRNQLTGLAAAEGARLLTLGTLSDDEAGQLLAGRLGAERVAAEPAAVDELIGLCARLPLALAIAAAWAGNRPQLPLAAVAAELRDTGGPLSTLDTGEVAGSVRAVFSWSYRLLTPPAAWLFRCLGLHPGPDIAAPAAASLAGVDLPQARQVLAELARTHLITEHAPGRYAFHDLLRAYAAERALAEDSEQTRRAAIVRVLDHYQHSAAAAARILTGTALEPVSPSDQRTDVTPELPAGRQQALAWFGAEHQVLLAAVALAAEAGLDSHAWELPRAMASFLDRRGHWHELAELQRTALAAAERLGDPARQAAAHRVLGGALSYLLAYDQAGAHLAACLRLYQDLGDDAGKAQAHMGQAWLSDRLDRYRDALSHAEQALVLYQAARDRAGQARALNSRGWYQAQLGDYQRARASCRKALALQRDLGDRWAEAHTADSLGYAEHRLGHLTEAASCYEHALRLCREVGDRGTAADVLAHLGDVHFAAGKIEVARASWREAMGIFDDLHHPDAGKVRAKLRQTAPAQAPVKDAVPRPR